MPYPRLTRATLVLATAAALTTSVGLPSATASPTDPALATKLSGVMRDWRVQQATSGAVVLDAADGTELYRRYAAQSITPASNTKIVTAVAAMHTLGPGYRFKTTVIRRASVVNGVLDGRLYLKGYGDPTTMVSDYRSLAQQVYAAGIRRVNGKLIVDSSFFDANRYNPYWSTGYASDYYAAQTSALTVAPNTDYDSGTIILNYRPGTAGGPARVTVSPAAAAKYVRIVNNTVTSASGTATTFSAHRTLGTNTITVSGRVPLNRSLGQRWITVHKPELYAGAVFRAELARLGIAVAGSTEIWTTPSTKRVVVGTDRSMTLANLLVPFMKLSNNMHAEALTKTMGTRTGRPGNWVDGLSYTKAYLRRLGVSLTGIVLVDGSGLTRTNKLTPLALGQVLQRVQRESWFPAFYASLPVAGVPDRMVGGTLRHRMTGTRAAGNAHAKTGTLTGVTALSGYVRGANGRRYVFSMLSQHSGASPRPVENTFVVTLANWGA